MGQKHALGRIMHHHTHGCCMGMEGVASKDQSHSVTSVAFTSNCNTDNLGENCSFSSKVTVCVSAPPPGASQEVLQPP